MWLFKNLGSVGSLKVPNRATQPNARKLEVLENKARGLRREKIPQQIPTRAKQVSFVILLSPTNLY